MKEKILISTDSNRKTGFGIISHNIAVGLANEGYDVYFLGWGFHHDEPIKRGNYTLLPVGQAPFGEDVLPYVIANVKPEVLLVQADTRMVMNLPQLLKQMPNKPTWVFYPVIDGSTWDVNDKWNHWPSNWTSVIKSADKVVAMCKYGQRILKENGIEADYIPHGVDTSVFKPIPSEGRESLKAQLGIPKDAFVFGSVFKNMQRKNPEKLLQTLRIIMESKDLTQVEKDKFVLLLHTAPKPMGGGEFDLEQQALDYGLQPGKNVLFSQVSLPTQMVQLVYQTLDAYIHLGGMEGFNATLIEAMSCGLPVVALDSGPHTEIVGDCGLLVKSAHNGKHKVTFGSYNGIECEIADPWDAAEQIMKLYKSEILRKELGFKATEKTLREYDWRIVNKKWADLMKSLIISAENVPAEWQKLYAETKV